MVVGSAPLDGSTLTFMRATLGCVVRSHDKKYFVNCQDYPYNQSSFLIMIMLIDFR